MGSETPFLGTIALFGGNFSPRGYAFCNGQLLAISQNDALFALIGTTYGGDGVSTFGLPDMRGRIPLHMGNGTGLTPRVIGERSGTENVALILQQMPAHTHTISGSSVSGNAAAPANQFWSADPSGDVAPFSDSPPAGLMSPAAIGTAGQATPHANMQPYLCVSFIIALEGIFPSRN